MKRYLIVVTALIFLIPFTGCKKKSFDPSSKSHSDFVGTWKGIISTFKDNKLVQENGSVVIYPNSDNTLLSGIVFLKETSVFREFQFINGTVYFKVINYNPSSPLCQNWSLGGYVVFADENTMEIRITGNECGQVGSEYVNWSGNLVKTQVPADSVKYFNFGSVGNSWTYQVFMKNGDSCSMQKQISQVSSLYQYSGGITQSCGWPGQTRSFKWNVTPDEYLVSNDSTLSEKPFSFPIYARIGATYYTSINKDTATVTLMDTNQVVITPAGEFRCSRFRYSEPVYRSGVKTNRVAYLWLNNRYGVVKQEVSNAIDSTDSQRQVLTTKSFKK